jgi:hypothetical protein
MNAEDFLSITPYGLVIGGHVTPIDHQYFNPARRDSLHDAYEVYAMADATIVDIQSRASFWGGDEYRLVFSMSCTLFYYYDLVTVLVPDVKAEFDKRQSGEIQDLRVPVKEGQLIGRIGGQTLDFAVWDTESILDGLVVPEHYAHEPWKIHTVDPLDYYTDELKVELLKKYLRTAPPISGKIDYDVDRRLIGNWFLVGTDGYGGGGEDPYWRGHLSLAPNHIDPTAFIVSFGNFGGEALQFAVKGNSPNPAEVSKETGLVKYNLVRYNYREPNGQFWDRESLARDLKLSPSGKIEGCALFKLLDERVLKVESFPGKKCSQVTGFTKRASLYER